MKFAVTCSIGTYAPPNAPVLYVSAPTATAARAHAASLGVTIGGYRALSFPVALLTHFPQGVTVHAA